MKKNETLQWSNSNDKAFIRALPYRKIKYLERGLFYAKKEEEVEMRIHEYLREDAISLDLKAATKKEAILELANLLREEKDIIGFDTFLSEVFAREKLTTTGIGYEIAIPHARTDTVEDFVVAFGRSKEGIDFDSMDGKPVKLIFLIGTPKNKKLGSYLNLLARLTRLLKKDDFRQSLLTASTPKDILNEFKRVQD